MQCLQIMSHCAARPAVHASSAEGARPRHLAAAGMRTTSALSCRSSYMGTRLWTPRTVLSPGGRRHSSDANTNRCRREVTRASFLGVGAPEAVLVGVVALVVFGPKGLAEAAKGVGKALRAFAPTLQELTSVSRDLKNTLDNELGIDEIRRDLASAQNAAFAAPTPKPRQPEGASSPTASATEGGAEPSLQAVTEQIAQSMDPEIERKRAESAQAAWGGAAPSGSELLAAELGGGGSSTEGGGSGGAKPALNELSLEDLQAELERRKQAAGN